MVRGLRSSVSFASSVLGFILALSLGVTASEAQVLNWGDLVVADGGLVHVKRSSGAQTRIPVPEGCCRASTFDGNGDILAVAGSPSRVMKVDVPSMTVSTVSQGQFFVTVNSIAVAGNGDILVTDHGANRVIRIDPTTGNQTLVSSGGFFSMPSGIVVGATGQIFVADANAFGNGGGVIRIDPTTGAQFVVSSGGNFGFNPSNGQSSDPTGIAFAANGDLLVADPRGVAHQGGIAGQVVRVNPVTGVQSVLSAGGLLADPWGIAVSKNGDIFVTDPVAFSVSARITRLDPAGATQTVVSAGNNLFAPLDIAIVPAIVDAGADQVLTANNVGQAMASLSGTSNSPPGSADLYCWTVDTASLVPPPAASCFATVPSVAVTAGPGVHTFRFWVTEPGGGSAFDDVQVTVQLPQIVGPPGPQGETGATGATGPKGDKGDTGEAGATGGTGPAGPAGPQGPIGPAGVNGLNGTNGVDGAPGATGATGATGAVGPAGSMGPQGPAGPAGANGLNGTNGVDGALGATGATGATGAVGPAGPMGPQGPIGPAGVNGLNGTNGVDGAPGVPGAQGATGLQGAAGATGAVGPAGPGGPMGPIGSMGPQGPIGPAGANGVNGTNGADGAPGATGAPGPAGAVGATGSIGPQGIPGPTGPQGPAGTPVSGSLLMMVEGVAPPPGYVLVGTFVEERIDSDGQGGQRPKKMRIVIWRKQ